MPASMEGQPGGSAGLTAQVFAILLRRIASGSNGEVSTQLYDALLSIVRRPAPGGASGPGGAVELALLRQSPDDDKIARAAAEIILSRTQADVRFGAALDDWCQRPQALELIKDIADETSRQRKASAPRARLARAARRPVTWIAAAALAGAATYVSTLVSASISNGASAVGKSLGIGHGPAGDSALDPGAPGSDSMAANVTVDQGIGCPPDNGDVYPASLTPSLNAAVQPGTGPRHSGKTWDAAPGAFGAVPASPAQLTIYATGPGNHAIIITGLTFHVVSRRKPVEGQWLNSQEYCGGGGSYHYGVVDFNTPPPYWRPVTALPPSFRADAIKFPYTATANDPEGLRVNVQMEDCDCTWYAVLSWIDETASKTMRIDDHGRPFETTSVTGVKETTWSAETVNSTTIWKRDTSLSVPGHEQEVPMPL